MRLELDLERVRLGEGPTPVRELADLGRDGGRAPVWIKDDGAYSALGGNKARKLEWLLGAAARRGKRTILTGGALGTNHGLATALFARRLGMRTVLVLVPQPGTAHVRGQLERLRETGAELHFPRGVRRAYLLAAWLFVARISPPLGFPYFLPPGGSVPLGCVGYVEAAVELRAQVESGELPEPSHVVVALGSGGTAAGLLAGLRLAGLRSRLVCVLVNDLIRVDATTVARLARRTLRLLRRHGAKLDDVEVSPLQIDVVRGSLGAGYGHSTPEAERAAELLADRGHHPGARLHRQGDGGAARAQPSRGLRRGPGAVLAHLHAAGTEAPVRVWVDCTAAAHPLVLRPILERLGAGGHEVRVTAREYGQTEGVLERLGIGYESVGRHGGGTRAGKAAAAARRSAALAGWARRQRFELGLGHGSVDLAWSRRCCGSRRSRCRTTSTRACSARSPFGLHAASSCRTRSRSRPCAARGARLGKLFRYPGLKEDYYLADFEPRSRGPRSARDRPRTGPGGRSSAARDLLLPRPPIRSSAACSIGSETSPMRVTVVHPPHRRRAEDRCGAAAADGRDLIVPDRTVDAQSLIALADLVVRREGR